MSEEKNDIQLEASSFSEKILIRLIDAGVPATSNLIFSFLVLDKLIEPIIWAVAFCYMTRLIVTIWA